MVDGSFVRPDPAKFVFRAEGVINADVKLVSIVLVVGISISHIESINTACKTDAGRIQSIAHRVIVRQRHVGEQRVLYEAGRVQSRPKGIAAENAELLKISCCSCRPDRIA